MYLILLPCMSPFVHGVTNTEGWAQNGSTQSHAFATFKCHFLANKIKSWGGKLLCAYFLFLHLNSYSTITTRQGEITQQTPTQSITVKTKKTIPTAKQCTLITVSHVLTCKLFGSVRIQSGVVGCFRKYLHLQGLHFLHPWRQPLRQLTQREQAGLWKAERLRVDHPDKTHTQGQKDRWRRLCQCLSHTAPSLTAPSLIASSCSSWGVGGYKV